MKQHSTHNDDTAASFVSGLVLGLLVSAPIAAWLSPRSGPQVRSDIRQRGMVIRRRTAEVIRKPITAIQSQITDLRGDSIADLLDEGKRLARRHMESPAEPDESAR